MKVRAFWLFLGFALAVSVLVLRLGYLQIPSKRRLEQIARGQRISPTTVDAQRGAILDRNFQTLAVSIGADAVWVVPSS